MTELVKGNAANSQVLSIRTDLNDTDEAVTGIQSILPDVDPIKQSPCLYCTYDALIHHGSL